ncbi:MAG: 7-cyano-7-deazaguanine synthase QueC [Stigonema ocellatum SAG 48.90 = DSM 106950]|nr:7-cyano-7-deazaguanine synthase QueC [Stigonema ocellatum SAG 48.90 = DSM 106950]
MTQSKALCVLSGGQDSTTCAALACQQFEQVHAITFDYGQRHVVELESAIAIAKAFNLASHEIIQLGPILKGTSPLVSDTSLGQYNSTEELPGGVEPTFVPARNILFLTLAGNRAAVLNIKDIFIGVCEADFAGYYDCRQVFVDAMAKAIGEGIWGVPDSFIIHTPLMQLTKAESVNLAVEVLGDRFEEIFALTHTCYAGIKGGCGKCHACLIRDRGFSQAGVSDPIWQFRLT